MEFRDITGVDPFGDFMSKFGTAAAAPATTAAGGTVVNYNNYGIDANNPYIKNALTPYMNDNARSRGQR